MRDDDQWVIVDTETDGLVAPVYAVEIAAQRMQGWKPVGKPFRILLNHDVDIDPYAEGIHGYSRKYLRKHGTKPTTAHKAFRQYAASLSIVSYNISFDWDRVLEPEYARLRVPPTGTRGFCSLLLSRRIITETTGHTLDTLKQHFKIASGPSHKALNDVKTLVELFQSVFRDRLVKAGISGFDNVAEFSRRKPILLCREMISKGMGKKR